jgi:hypothetical protein
LMPMVRRRLGNSIERVGCHWALTSFALMTATKTIRAQVGAVDVNYAFNSSIMVLYRKIILTRCSDVFDLVLWGYLLWWAKKQK